MTGGELYDGLAVERLPIEAVDVPDPVHLRRSLRYPGAEDVEAEHAIEAVFDPRPADRRIRATYEAEEAGDG